MGGAQQSRPAAAESGIPNLWVPGPYAAGQAVTTRHSCAESALPRQQVRQDQVEALRVAGLFQYLEQDDPLVDRSPGSRGTVCRRLSKGGLLPGLLVALLRLEIIWLCPSNRLDFASTMLVHTLAGVLTYVAMGPCLQLLSGLMLRIARAQQLWFVTQIVRLNGMLLREERIICSVLCAWAINFSWWSSPLATKEMLWRPCSAVLLLILTNGLRKMLEFAFLAPRLRTRFEADVLSNAFERAAFQRLDTLAGSDPLPPATSVLPGVSEPHAFERHTAEMLTSAFSLAGPQSAPRRPPSPSLPPSMLMRAGDYNVFEPFVMQRESSFGEAEDESIAAGTFNLLSTRHDPPRFVADTAQTDGLEGSLQMPEGPKAILVRTDLDGFMLPVDADRTWQVLSCHKDVASREWISREDYLQAVRGTTQRFHAIAATIKDYAGIWLVFSNVLTVLQVLMAAVILLAVFSPQSVLSAISISLPTAFVGLSFIFGSTLRELFESLVLILVVQPFEVGDRISLPDDDEEQQRCFVVKKINLLTTELRETASNQCIYFKNVALFDKCRLVNLGRSLNAVVELAFELPASQLTLEVVTILEAFVRRYMARRAATWVPSYIRSFAHLENSYMHCDLSGAVNFRFRVMHCKPWQCIREIRSDVTSMEYAILEKMRRMGLDFRLTTKPVQLEGDGGLAIGGPPESTANGVATPPIARSLSTSWP